jgi:methyl-accepting chemotaxis protein
MNVVMAPGLTLMRRLSNKGKMPLCSALYLLPLAILYAETGSHASNATRVAMAVFVSLGAYLMYCWYIQARNGFSSLEKVAGRIAEGDLTADAHAFLGGSFSNLMKALGHVNNSLGGIVSNVRASSNAVAHSAGQIADANADLSNRTEEQASSLEETASGMEELARTVKQNAGNCESAADLARNAETVARQGADVVHEVVQGMGNIDQSSRRMADIIGVIEGIAFQTNILALNAAVEAARAGELGRGFAVVASEVRTLAQSSAQAAKEIRSLIQQSVDEIKDGSRKAERAGAVIDEIVSSVHEVSQLIGQIAVSSSQQSAGVHEINKAIVQLETVTQQNAAVVQEVAASSFTLQEQADCMRDLVARFKIIEAKLPPQRSAMSALTLRPPSPRLR